MSAREGWQVLSRVTAAVVGGLGLAMSATVLLAIAVKPSRELGVAVAVPLAIPLWLLAMCPGFLARRAVRSWVVYLGGAIFLSSAAWLLARSR